MSASEPAAPAGRRLCREPDSGLLAGVCSGLAVRLDLDPVLVRVAFVLFTVVSGGLGAVVYAVLWAVVPAARTVPAAPARADSPARTLSRGGRTWALALGTAMIVLGVLLSFRELGLWWSDALVWPLVLAAGGAALLWRQAASATNRLGPYRGGFGVALVVGAATLFLYGNGALGAAKDAALAAVVVLFGLALILLPFWVRLGRNLAAERAARIRSQERAEVAAHLHDSVLQTLALVQKRSDDPKQVATLARRQERELRQWLSGKPEAGRDSGVAAALKAAAAEVEEQHGVPIDAVTVGEGPLDERGEALVAASREAMANAARHAGEAGPIALYAEVTPERAQVFVHDRGAGFDLDSVPEDRRGVRDSILGRMRRNGGEAAIRSTPGEGTEVELTMEAER